MANIFGGILGKIQENLLKEDLHQIATNGDTFFSTADTAYLIFMIIGIIGYFSVPSVANYIVHAGGGNALLQKVTDRFAMASSQASSMTVAGGGMAVDALGSAASQMKQGMAGHGASDN